MKQKVLFFFLLFFFNTLFSENLLVLRDLSRVTDFAHQKVVTLYGRDSFDYTNRNMREKGIRVSFPCIWQEFIKDPLHIAWFRIPVFIPQDVVRGDSFSVMLGKIVLADELYFNGHLIGKTGDVEGQDYNYGKVRIYNIPERWILFGETNVFALRVRGGFNDSGPYRGKFKFGPSLKLFKDVLLSNLFQYTFAIIYLLFGISYFSYWIFFKKKLYFLSFSIYSFGLGLYRLLRSNLLYFYTDEFAIFKNIEYSLAHLLVPLFGVFLVQFFNRKEKKILLFYLYFSFLMSAISFFLPSVEWKWRFLSWVELTWLLPVGMCVWTLGGEILKKKRTAQVMFFAFLIGILGVFLDVLNTRAIILLPMDVTPFAVLVFMFSFAFLLNHEVQTLYVRTDHLNEELEAKVEERTQKLRLTMGKLREYNSTLEQLALLDGLTGLYNRRFFDERYRSELKRVNRRGGYLALFLLDVDSFKELNDTYGHPFGDEVLVRLAEILGQMVRRESDSVSRYGGDEFVALLPDTSLEQAGLLAERIRKKVEQTVVKTDKDQVSFTITVGVTAVQGFQEREDFLLERGDKALYQAKEKGKNRVVIL